MTTELLYESLNYIIRIDKQSQLQASLTAISSALTTLVQQPANPSYQSTLATALEKFDSACSKLRESLTPARREHLEQLGGVQFFDPIMAAGVRRAIGENAMTPSVAAAYVQDLLQKRATFLSNVTATFAGMQELGLSDYGIEQGHADVAFVIPRRMFDNNLEAFAKELTFLSRLVRDMEEAQTGTARTPELQSLSTSEPTVAILAAFGAIKLIAETVKSFLDVWKKVQELRQTRERLIELGLSGAAVGELDNRVTELVEEVVETTTTMSISVYPPSDDGRRRELENSIRNNTRKLFGQIEQGLIVQFRADADPEGEDPKTKDLEIIAQIGRNLEFPVPSEVPLLLERGTIIDGGGEQFRTIIQTVKKQSTKKTSVKKQAQVAGAVK